VKIGKPLLLITTPIGLAIGLYEGWRLAGGLVFVMATFIAFLGFAFLTIVLTIRREWRQEEERKREPREEERKREPREEERKRERKEESG
jgi:predicted MFS family arabinose efflux permease